MLNFYKGEKKEYKNFWNILIVDDELDVHTITKTVLKDFIFDNKKINFTSAYSGKEAYEILKKSNNFAVILLDVIMEQDDAGLVLAQKIRGELKNTDTRIILRTGQAGDMPIKKLLVKYDINDYTEKTQLTASKLYIVLLLAIKSYKQIEISTRKNLILEKIIEANNLLSQKKEIKEFVKEFLLHIKLLLILKNKNLIIKEYLLKQKVSFLDEKPVSTIKEDFLLKDLENKTDIIYKENMLLFMFKLNNDDLVISIDSLDQVCDLGKKLINVFINSSRSILKNLSLSKTNLLSQEELIKILSKLLLEKSIESKHHLINVSEIVFILASKYGLSKQEALKVKIASTVHDIGELVIDNQVLKKSLPLNDEEQMIFQNHTNLGHDILKEATSPLIKAASIIAHEHHESWNGSGYPRKLKESKIHLYARITTVADVYDSLRNPINKQEAWPHHDILNFFKKNKNIIFEDKLVDILCENIEEIENIFLN